MGAKGRLAKALVFRGTKEKTVGGLKRDGLMKNKRGKIVSKKASAAGKRSFRNVEYWVASVVEARKQLHMSGFVAINGKSVQGKALYVKSKALAVRHRGAASHASVQRGDTPVKSVSPVKGAANTETAIAA